MFANFLDMMDTKRVISCLLVPGLVLISLVGQKTSAVEFPQRQNSATDKQLLAEFNERVKNYLKQRGQVKEKLPKLSKDSTPEQIEAHQKALIEALRAARISAEPGDVFSEEVANYIRQTLRNEFKGKDRREVRETILAADTKGVPLKVNYPYPESKELTEVPATLLLELPQLPKEVKYRFVRRHMLLVDTDSGIIVDYMLNALP